LLTQESIAGLCDRRFGIGADGLILLEQSSLADFSMKYFNADGRPGSFCGNGARCIVRFAASLGIVRQTVSFEAADGLHQAGITEKGEVWLRMRDVEKITLHSEFVELNTGSPHLVVSVTDLANTDVVSLGKNVNFMQRTPADDQIELRTYERGVEDETYSCGTGAVAAAIACAPSAEGAYQFTVVTKGGLLSVHYTKKEARFEDIILCGPAAFVFETSFLIKGSTV
jgi:diaminopimelate epimerase